MADRGLCSRREADDFIEKGWVFVDGQRVDVLGTRIDPEAQVTLAADARENQNQRVTVLLHKPVGYVSGQPEPGYEPAVVLIRPENQGSASSGPDFHPSMKKGEGSLGTFPFLLGPLLTVGQAGVGGQR